MRAARAIDATVFWRCWDTGDEQRLESTFWRASIDAFVPRTCTLAALQAVCDEYDRASFADYTAAFARAPPAAILNWFSPRQLAMMAIESVDGAATDRAGAYAWPPARDPLVALEKELCERLVAELHRFVDASTLDEGGAHADVVAEARLVQFWTRLAWRPVHVRAIVAALARFVAEVERARDERALRALAVRVVERALCDGRTLGAEHARQLRALVGAARDARGGGGDAPPRADGVALDQRLGADELQLVLAALMAGGDGWLEARPRPLRSALALRSVSRAARAALGWEAIGPTLARDVRSGAERLGLLVACAGAREAAWAATYACCTAEAMSERPSVPVQVAVEATWWTSLRAACDEARACLARLNAARRAASATGVRRARARCDVALAVARARALATVPDEACRVAMFGTATLPAPCARRSADEARWRALLRAPPIARSRAGARRPPR